MTVTAAVLTPASTHRLDFIYCKLKCIFEGCCVAIIHFAFCAQCDSVSTPEQWLSFAIHNKLTVPTFSELSFSLGNAMPQNLTPINIACVARAPVTLLRDNDAVATRYVTTFQDALKLHRFATLERLNSSTDADALHYTVQRFLHFQFQS